MRCLRNVPRLLGLSCALVAPIAFAAPPKTINAKTVPKPTQVLTCAIEFPLDDVRFDEKQIVDCFKDVKADRIAYLHVFATATPPGTVDHNFYLSNRRAGAIEAYLKNHYPAVPVHAFAGGQNDKFGKMARIFAVIVPETPPANPNKVIEVAPAPLVQAPPQIEYRVVQAPPSGISVSCSLGSAAFLRHNDPYQLIAAEATAPLPRDGFGTKIHAGLRYAALQSNPSLDARSLMLVATRGWNLPSASKWMPTLVASPKLYLGAAQTSGTASDAGLGADFGAQFNQTVAGIELAQTKHFRWIALSVKALL